MLPLFLSEKKIGKVTTMSFLSLETRSAEMFEFRVFEKNLIPKLDLSV